MTRIAYLVSDYDAPSHTFIRREVAALQSAGLNIEPFSIRSSNIPETVVRGARAKAVLTQPAAAYILSPMRAFGSAPLRFLQTWRLALRHRQPGLRGLLWAHFHFHEALVLCDMLRRFRADHLHVHFANSAATVALLASRMLGLSWSVTLHGISETDHPAGGLLGEKLHSARFVACASWFMKAQGMRVVDSSQWSKFHVVRCGLDPGTLLETKQSPAESPINFVSVGRLSPEKGYAGLLSAFSELTRLNPANRLTIIGDGPLREQIEADIEARSLGDFVNLTGWLSTEDVLAKMAAADVFILPSLMEGLPVVLIEAMALGKPVIASWVAGIPELVTDEISGLLFRPSDWIHLSRQMRRLAEDPELRSRLGTAAKDAVFPEYDVKHSVVTIARLLREVTTSRPSG